MLTPEDTVASFSPPFSFHANRRSLQPQRCLLAWTFRVVRHCPRQTRASGTTTASRSSSSILGEQGHKTVQGHACVAHVLCCEWIVQCCLQPLSTPSLAHSHSLWCICTSFIFHFISSTSSPTTTLNALLAHAYVRTYSPSPFPPVCPPSSHSPSSSSVSLPICSTIIANNLLLVDEVMRAGMSSLKGN